MDILDFYGHDRKEEYLSGYYRKDEGAEPIYFEYGIASEERKEYNVEMDRVYADNLSLTIKTTWNVGFEINGYVETQDGKEWQVSTVSTIVTERNKQVTRLLRSNPSKAFEVTLIGTAKPDEPKVY